MVYSQLMIIDLLDCIFLIKKELEEKENVGKP